MVSACGKNPHSPSCMERGRACRRYLPFTPSNPHLSDGLYISNSCDRHQVIIMLVLAVQHSSNAASFFRANMVAGDLCYSLHIATAFRMHHRAAFIRLAVAVMSFHCWCIATVSMGMYALCDGLVAFSSVFMTTGAPFRRSRIIVLCILPIILLSFWRFRRKQEVMT